MLFFVDGPTNYLETLSLPTTVETGTYLCLKTRVFDCGTRKQSPTNAYAIMSGSSQFRFYQRLLCVALPQIAALRALRSGKEKDSFSSDRLVKLEAIIQWTHYWLTSDVA